MKGKAQIFVRRADAHQQRADYFQRSPLRVFLPHTYASQDLEVVLGNTAGGLVAGDELDVEVALDRQTAVAVTSQAAEKVYRSLGADTKIAIHLQVGAEARLQWVPRETILFDGMRLRRRLWLDVHPDASALAGEILIFGRLAQGEQLRYGLVHDEWRVRYAGQLQWADNLHLAGDLAAQLQSPVGFDGSQAMASLVYVAAQAPDMLDHVRSLLSTAVSRTGVTLIGNVMLVRWLDRDPAALKQSYEAFVVTFGADAGFGPSALPPVWYV